MVARSVSAGTVSDMTATFLPDEAVVQVSEDVVRPGTDEFDVPLGGLTALSRLQLGRTHMEAAVAEVRFVPTPGRDALPEATAVAVWKGLGGRKAFPVFERHTMNAISLVVTPDGADSSAQVQHGWVLATADRRTAVTLFPSTVVVQTREYERFSTSLAGRLRAALRLFVDASDVHVVQRVGLRYINRMQDPAASHAVFWHDHVRPAFRGPLAGDLAPLVEASHQQAHLRLDETAAARVQSGVFREQGPEDRYSFLVDLDVFREEAFPFDDDLCANITRQLNRTAFALFCQVLSDKYLAELGPVEVEEVRS